MQGAGTEQEDWEVSLTTVPHGLQAVDHELEDGAADRTVVQRG